MKKKDSNINREERRAFIKKAWVVPTLIVFETANLQAKQSNNLSELCDKTNENSLFCQCMKDPTYNPACPNYPD